MDIREQKTLRNGEKMEFETKRLILRPWKETDAESLYEYAKDPAVGPIAGWPIHTSVENSWEIINTVLSAPDTYAVCLKEDGKAIGSVGLISPMQSHTNAVEDEIEVGYWIGVPFWGNGYIPEAVRRIQKYVFEGLGYRAMWCGYYDGNEKSKRCQEKCGFSYHHTEENKPCALMGDVRTEHFTYLTREDWKRKNTAVVFIHGKGGNAKEADHYCSLFKECDVYGFDYKNDTPWETKSEFLSEIESLHRKYRNLVLIACSIGAYFSMNADIDSMIQKAYFISPIVNMEKLITDMMQWANVSEERLQKEKQIETSFGETLSLEYLTYVRKHPVHWEVPTDILYGEKDNLTSIHTMEDFVRDHAASLTVMKDGEHWFHTKEQMEFLDQWIRKVKSI